MLLDRQLPRGSSSLPGHRAEEYWHNWRKTQDIRRGHAPRAARVTTTSSEEPIAEIDSRGCGGVSNIRAVHQENDRPKKKAGEQRVSPWTMTTTDPNRRPPKGCCYSIKSSS